MAGNALTFTGKFIDEMSKNLKKATKNTDKLTKSMDKSAKAGEKAGKGSQKASDGVSSANKSMMGTMGTAVGLGTAMLGLAAAFKATAKASGEFEVGMSRVATMLDAVTMTHLPDLSSAVHELSRTFNRDAKDIQGAMFQTLSAGVDAGEAVEFLAIAAEASVGGFTEMETAVDGLTSVVNAYGMASAEAADVSNAIFAANKYGKTTFEEIAKGVGRVAPTANLLGIRFGELAASVASVTKQGLATSEVFVGMRGAMVSILKPTKEAQELANKLGLDFSETGIKARGLTKFLNDVKEATDGDTTALATLFPNVRALAYVAAQTSKTGLRDMGIALDDIDKGLTTAGDAAGKAKDDFAFHMGQMEKQSASLSVAIGKDNEHTARQWERVTLSVKGLIASYSMWNTKRRESFYQGRSERELLTGLDEDTKRLLESNQDFLKTDALLMESSASMEERQKALTEALKKAKKAVDELAASEKRARDARIQEINDEMMTGGWGVTADQIKKQQAFGKAMSAFAKKRKEATKAQKEGLTATEKEAEAMRKMAKDADDASRAIMRLWLANQKYAGEQDKMLEGPSWTDKHEDDINRLIPLIKEGMPGAFEEASRLMALPGADEDMGAIVAKAQEFAQSISAVYFGDVGDGIKKLSDDMINAALLGKELAGEGGVQGFLDKLDQLQMKGYDVAESMRIMGEAGRGVGADMMVAARAFSDAGKAVKKGLAQGVAQAITAFLSGQQAFGDAMASMTRDLLFNIAQQAAAKALFETAEGIAALAAGLIPVSAGHFAAAKAYGAVAAMGYAGGAAIHVATGGSFGAPEKDKDESSTAAGPSVAETARTTGGGGRPTAAAAPIVINAHFTGQPLVNKAEIGRAIDAALGAAEREGMTRRRRTY